MVMKFQVNELGKCGSLNDGKSTNLSIRKEYRKSTKYQKPKVSQNQEKTVKTKEGRNIMKQKTNMVDRINKIKNVLFKNFVSH